MHNNKAYKITVLKMVATALYVPSRQVIDAQRKEHEWKPKCSGRRREYDETEQVTETDLADREGKQTNNKHSARVKQNAMKCVSRMSGRR